MISTCPFVAAQCSGCMPVALMVMLTGAPAAMNACSKSTWPKSAAQCTGVAPSCVSNSLSASGNWAMRDLACSTWPSLIAATSMSTGLDCGASTLWASAAENGMSDDEAAMREMRWTHAVVRCRSKCNAIIYHPEARGYISPCPEGATSARQEGAIHAPHAPDDSSA